jgi:hypothetical protein
MLYVRIAERDNFANDGEMPFVILPIYFNMQACHSDQKYAVVYATRRLITVRKKAYNWTLS